MKGPYFNYWGLYSAKDMVAVVIRTLCTYGALKVEVCLTENGSVGYKDNLYCGGLKWTYDGGEWSRGC